jgi:hypothetical protein
MALAPLQSRDCAIKRMLTAWIMGEIEVESVKV